MNSDKSNQNEPPKKPQKQTANIARKQKDLEIKVLNDDGGVERTFKISRSGLTARQHRELRNKDPNLLTASEKQSLREAQERLNKTVQSLVSQYDFSGMAKLAQMYTVPPIAQQSISKVLAINTPPILKVVADMQKSSLAMQPSLNKALGIQMAALPAMQTIYKSTLFTQNQFSALAAIQKSLRAAYPTDSFVTAIKGIQEAFQAPLIARTMLADFHTSHERILRNLQFDVGSLRASIEFSRFETVDFAIDDIAVDEDNLTATATVTQTNTVGNVTLTDTAGLQLILNKLDANQRELHRHSTMKLQLS